MEKLKARSDYELEALLTFSRHLSSFKPEMVANVQAKIQIVATHESLETCFNIGFPASAP